MKKLSEADRSNVASYMDMIAKRFDQDAKITLVVRDAQGSHCADAVIGDDDLNKVIETIKSRRQFSVGDAVCEWWSDMWSQAGRKWTCWTAANRFRHYKEPKDLIDAVTYVHAQLTPSQTVET